MVSAAVVLYLLGDAVVRGGVAEAALLAPWPLLALWGVYVAAFASRVTIDDAGVLVQNMLQTVWMPWPHIADVQWRWQVQFDLDDGRRVRAMGGPAQGRSPRRPSDPDRIPATARAQYDVIVRAWETARAAGSGRGCVGMAGFDEPRGPGAAEPARDAVRRGWDTLGIVSAAVLVAWAVVAVIVAGA